MIQYVLLGFCGGIGTMIVISIYKKILEMIKI